MAAKQVFQTALLLMAGQAFLGLAGLLSKPVNWLGLPATIAFGWLIWRVGWVVRGQLDDLRRRGRPVAPRETALWIAVLWQIPAYLTAPLWAPQRPTDVWQGAVLPVLGLLDLTFPGTGSVLGPGLWLAFLAEGAIFVWLVGRVMPVPGTLQERPAHAPAPGAEWAPIRRFEEAILARDAGRGEPKE